MQTPEKFPFPFSPYHIQNQFMETLYKCLENANLGIFESPTGTGKSMSIICGALKWLTDYEELQKKQLNTAIFELDEKIKECVNSSNDWLTVQTEQMQMNSERQILQAKLTSILQYELKKNSLKETVKNINNKKKLHIKIKKDCTKHEMKTENHSSLDKLNVEEENIEEELLLEDLIQHSDSSENEDEENDIYENTKIFFCSRTHSQLSQFIGELKKSPYSKNISVITLASR